MANIYAIRSVYNETTGDAYQNGTDYDDDGTGVPDVVTGSQLEDDIANGDTIKYVTGTGSDSGPGVAMYYRIDASYSGVRRLDQLNNDWSGGTEVDIDLDGIHVNEHLRSHQSNCNFNGPADVTSCRDLEVGDWIALRLGLATVDGTKTWRKEWRFKVAERKHSLDSLGIRHFNWFAADPNEETRLADVSEIPRGADAELETLPGDTGSTPQLGLLGPKIYHFSDLLRTVLPAGATFVLNAPDFTIERLPEQGDGLELLVAAMDASSYDMRWDVNRLIIEQFEPRAQLASLILTDDHILEAKRTLGARRKALDSVRIERPHQFPMPGLATSTPDPDLPPVNTSGAAELPSEPLINALVGSEEIIYEVNKVWRPVQTYVDRQPAPLMYAFGDPAFLKVNWTSEQLFIALRQMNGQIAMTPPIARYDPYKIKGYFGLDYYFKVPAAFLKIQESNADTVDVWVVSRAGLFLNGATNFHWTPVANAKVLLRDPITGITLGPRTTNGNGYAQFDTGGNRARWVASVYHVSDAYLANKLDDFTIDHPYDNDLDNDDLGPDNSVEVTEEFQLPEEQSVQFRLIWKTGRVPGVGPGSTLGDLAQSYRSKGAFTFGQAGPEVLNVDELSSLNVDPANITTEHQAGLWSEKKIQESEEELDSIDVTRMFSGTECEVGRVVHVLTSIDEDIDEKARILTRQIRVSGAELVETFSTKVDKFVDKMKLRYAMRRPVEDKLRQLTKNNKRVADWLVLLTGQLGDESNLSNG